MMVINLELIVTVLYLIMWNIVVGYSNGIWSFLASLVIYFMTNIIYTTINYFFKIGE